MNYYSELKIPNDIIYKLPPYDVYSCKMGLSINWAKVKILTKNVKCAQTIIKALHGPYKKIAAGDNVKNDDCE